MLSSITTAGNVGAVVDPFAQQAASTPEGARWLNAYIDPAHGNCDTIPDEDNIYSIAVKSHFTYTLDNTFFAPNGITSGQGNRSFTVYLTNIPEYPIAVYGYFYETADNGTAKLVYIRDPNVSPMLSNDGINSCRMMYKGCTLRYTGNQYNNQGVLTCCQFAPSQKWDLNSVKDNKDKLQNFLINYSVFPLTSSDIASSNKEFYVNRQEDGVYMSNQIMGARSEYVDGSFRRLMGGIYGHVPNTSGGYGSGVTDEDHRFDRLTSDIANYSGFRFSFNATWGVMRFDNIDRNQSILIEHFGGYQCHTNAGSDFTNFQTFKSYLDPNALAVASQLTASLPMIWPASYNDFRQVWSKITRYLGSARGQNLINTIASVSGAYGGLVRAIGGIFT